MTFNYQIKANDNSLFELGKELAHAEMKSRIAYSEYTAAIREIVIIKSKIEKELTKNV